MSRTVFPFLADDMSALARSLKRELDASTDRPGHVDLLNMLARGAGYRNFQHFRAQGAAAERLAHPRPPEPEEPVDLVRIERAARHFADSVLVRWPSKRGLQILCVWVVWSRLPAGEDLTEKQVNALITAEHTFGDYALIRRDLVDIGLLGRTQDGRRYWRIESRPPADARALIRHVGRRSG